MEITKEISVKILEMIINSDSNKWVCDSETKNILSKNRKILIQPYYKSGQIYSISIRVDDSTIYFGIMRHFEDKNILEWLYKTQEECLSRQNDNILNIVEKTLIDIPPPPEPPSPSHIRESDSQPIEELNDINLWGTFKRRLKQIF